jgi:hypothetical protein
MATVIVLLVIALIWAGYVTFRLFNTADPKEKIAELQGEISALKETNSKLDLANLKLTKLHLESSAQETKSQLEQLEAINARLATYDPCENTEKAPKGCTSKRGCPKPSEGDLSKPLRPMRMGINVPHAFGSIIQKHFINTHVMNHFKSMCGFLNAMPEEDLKKIAGMIYDAIHASMEQPDTCTKSIAAAWKEGKCPSKREIRAAIVCSARAANFSMSDDVADGLAEFVKAVLDQVMCKDQKISRKHVLAFLIALKDDFYCRHGESTCDWHKTMGVDDITMNPFSQS